MRIKAPVLFAIWSVHGALLAILAILAWAATEGVQERIQALQRAYGTGPYPAWYQRADAHVHLVVSLLVCLWFGVACRLFQPRWLPWAPLAATLVVAWVDELAQIGSLTRTFEWSDQAGDLCGMVLAFPLLLLLGRLKVDRAPRRDADPRHRV